MTDNEIIKAWKDKITLIELDESPTVSIELITNTLDLINRLKAENESLQEAVKDLRLEMSYMIKPNTFGFGDRHEMGNW